MPQNKDIQSVYLRIGRVDFEEYKLYLSFNRTSITEHLTGIVREYIQKNRSHYHLTRRTKEE